MIRVPSVVETLEQFETGDIDPTEHAAQVIEALRKWEDPVNAFIYIERHETLLSKAENAAKRWKRGEARRLEGVLIGVKDNIVTSFMPTTAGSKILEGFKPPFNATVVERLISEGAIIVGKTNLDEFAMGSTGELSAFGATRNPWDLSRVPGGSSSGSGACLAYGGCDLALGSDTGGSVRLPAAFTATVGLKPTYGLVSRYGLIPYGNSLEQISPMARSVKDAALLLEVIGGYDPLDATSLKLELGPGSIMPEGPASLEKTRICVPASLVDLAEKPIASMFYSVIHSLESQGAVIENINISGASKALPAYYTIALAEAASNLARYDGTLYPSLGTSGEYWRFVAETRGRGFGIEVKRRILMGVYVLSEGYRDEYYLAATRLRRVIRDEMIKHTSRCIVATPASPIMPPRIGERVDDPLKLYAMDAYTVLANLSGLPALVQPIGFHNGLPIGIQIIGPKLGEKYLLSLGLALEDIVGISSVIAG